MKILIQYLSLPHYRKTLFHELLENGEIEYNIMAGIDSPYNNLKNFIIADKYLTKYHKLRNIYYDYLGHRFIIQKGIIKTIIKIKPNKVIMLGYDPHILSNYVLFIVCKIMKIKTIWWGHATLGSQGNIGIFIRKWIYKLSDGILVYDKSGLQRLLECNISPENIQIVNNCLNNEDYPTLTEVINSDRDLFNIIVVARIEARKKIDFLIKAIGELSNQYKNLKLTVIGEGPETNHLKKITDEHNLIEKIIFTGALYGSELKQKMLSASIMVIPSSSGLSIINALAHGIGIITHNNYNNQGPEVYALNDNITCTYYEENNLESLKNAIIYRINNKFDPQVCYLSIINKYHPQKCAQLITNFIKRI